MLVGVPKEIKNHEYRVSLSPSGVREIIQNGHQVVVQKDAGSAIGFDDALYRAVGALVVPTAEEIYEQAELIVKVKEPQAQECRMIREGQVVFSYLHLAAEPRLTDMLLESGCVAIAFETVTGRDVPLPLLAPMSEVAGRVAIQAGAFALEKSRGGRGVLLSGVPGVEPGKVAIIGGGVVGINAAMVAAGQGAHVTILDKSLKRLKEIDMVFGSKIRTAYSTTETIERYVTDADLVVGAVLIPGAAAPKLVTRDMVSKMKKGAVITDVAIDQGGCFETSQPTTHEDPTYIVDGIIHYCVTNMPSAVARTSSQALENAILPYALALADKGYRVALRDDEHFRHGLNIHHGKITHEAVAQALGHSYVPPKVVLG